MTRPAFVLTVDERTPAILTRRGHELRTQRFDVGTQVLYAPDDEQAPDAAGQVARALAASGLAERLRPGMALTLLVSDLAVPAPAAVDDVRATMAEQVLELAARTGVDDVAVLVANGLSRRPTDAEMERTLGERVARSFRAVDALLTHDAEAFDLADLGEAEGVPLTIAPRLAASDLVVDLRVLAQAPDPVEEAVGGWCDVVLGASGVATVDGLRRPGAPASAGAALAALAERSLDVVQLVAVLGQPVVAGPLALVSRREWEWGPRDRAALAAFRRGMALAPEATARGAYGGLHARYAVLGVVAGDPATASGQATELFTQSRRLAVPRPADVLAVGVEHPVPSAPSSVTNPLVAAWAVLARGGLAADPRVLRDGGTIVGLHPLTPRFSTRHHAASADLFAAMLADGPDAVARERDRLGRDAWLVDLYRHQHAFHPLQQFHLWEAGRAARERAGQVIWVGARRAHARAFGHRAASTWADALEIARDQVGATPQVTVVRGGDVVVVDR